MANDTSVSEFCTEQGYLGINQATHPPTVRQSGRPAAGAGLQDPPGPLTAVARGWRPYGGINPSLGCKFGVQATVRTGKSLTVGFRPLPDWTPGGLAPVSWWYPVNLTVLPRQCAGATPSIPCSRLTDI